MRYAVRGIAPWDQLAYRRGMAWNRKTCPECGTNEVKTLVPMTGTQPAYLCKNGHFFMDSPPPKPLARSEFHVPGK